MTSPRGFTVAPLDRMAHPEWPYWAPIRHAFDIRAFGINSWRKDAGGAVIPEHDETETGHEELYLVVDGHAVFTIGGAEVDAPKETAIFVRDASLKRGAVAKEDGTHVLSIGGWRDRPFEVSDWEAKYCDGIPTLDESSES